MDLDFLVTNGDNFETILSRIQQDCSKILCLLNDKIVLEMTPESIEKTGLIFQNYSLPENSLLAPIYNFLSRSGDKYSFFSCERISAFLPQDIIRGPQKENIEFFRDYSVLLYDSGICKEFRQKDNYVSVEKIELLFVSSSNGDQKFDLNKIEKNKLD